MKYLESKEGVNMMCEALVHGRMTLGALIKVNAKTIIMRLSMYMDPMTLKMVSGKYIKRHKIKHNVK